jgi:CBS domain-containing protein
MKTAVAAIEAQATLRDAARALSDADVGTLVIMDGPEITGIVSERDVVRALAGDADPDTVLVGDVMSESPRYVTLDERAATAIETMLAAGIRHLPVIDEGELVGIISMRDLVEVLFS